MTRLTKRGRPVGIVMKESFVSYVLVLGASLLSIVVNVAGLVVSSTSAGRISCLFGAASSVAAAVLAIWWRYRTVTDV